MTLVNIQGKSKAFGRFIESVNFHPARFFRGSFRDTSRRGHRVHPVGDVHGLPLTLTKSPVEFELPNFQPLCLVNQDVSLL